MFLLPSGIKNGQPYFCSLENVGLSAVVLFLLDHQAMTTGRSVRSFCVTKDPPHHEDTTIFLYLILSSFSIFYVYFAVASQRPSAPCQSTPVEAILSRPCPEFTDHSLHTLSCHLLPKSSPRFLSPSRIRRIRR